MKDGNGTEVPHWLVSWSGGCYCYTARVRGKLWGYPSGAPDWARDLLVGYRAATGATLATACRAVASAIEAVVARKLSQPEGTK